MSWVRFDDQVGQHPKIVRAGSLAGWLWFKSTIYCGQYLTDGFVPEAAIGTLARFDDALMPVSPDESPIEYKPVDPIQLANLLDRIGLWESPPCDSCEAKLKQNRSRVPENDHEYTYVHGYLDHNPSRRDADNVRRIRSDAGKKGGELSGLMRRSKNEANAKQTVKQNRSKNEPRPRPPENLRKRGAEATPHPPGLERKTGEGNPPAEAGAGGPDEGSSPSLPGVVLGGTPPKRRAPPGNRNGQPAEVTTFLAHYGMRYAAARGVAFVAAPGKDQAMVARLLKQITVAELVTLAEGFLRTGTVFARKQSDFGLGMFAHELNALRIMQRKGEL